MRALVRLAARASIFASYVVSIMINGQICNKSVRLPGK